MAKYLVLIFGDEQRWAAASPEWLAENGEQHNKFRANAGGAVIGGHELHPASEAVTIRSRSGKRARATDGPFLETKEAVGGYYLIEAPDMEHAIELAQQIPEVSADHSGVEVRAIVE